MEHLPTLSHLKPILQRLVFIKNATFPLLARPPAAKLLEGRGGEPLAVARDAIHGCTGTAELRRNAFIQKEKCDSLGVTYLALTLINAERPFCPHRSHSSALRGLGGRQRRCNSAKTFNKVPHNVKVALFQDKITHSHFKRTFYFPPTVTWPVIQSAKCGSSTGRNVFGFRGATEVR